MKTDLDALISLHDVMPQTFLRMEEILRYMKEHGIPPITLLIVPGLDWTPRQIKRLHQLADEGYEMAAHGWKHQVSRISGPYHRLHAAFISRNVAEHLALESEEILELMINSSNWFVAQDLPRPSLYVPPAWALGSLDQVHLRQLPYSEIEVLRGIITPIDGNLHRFPMVGFETDTFWREFWVRQWNKRQLKKAYSGGQPLRIGIHPNDFALRSGKSLRTLLSQSLRHHRYDSLELAPVAV